MKCNLSDLLLGDVIDWRMVVCDVVIEVVSTRRPEVPKLSLCISALQLVELHVHRLCLAGDNFFISYSNRSKVVALDM